MAFAVPAKPVWQKIVMADGSVVTAMKCGDENFHYYRTDTGTLFVKDTDGSFREVDGEELTLMADKAPRRAKMNKRMAQRRAAKATTGTTVSAKKGLVIMVSFSNVDFRDKNAWTEWNDILNKVDYDEHGAPGSVHDYFLDQSNSKFNLTFDLVGPVKLPNTHYYYGDNGKQYGGLDINMGECVAEACKAIDSLVNFRDYDWDGDGEVDQVFVLYAGCGENAAGVVNDSLIWPHAYELKSYRGYEKGLTLDDVTINTYACSCELDGQEKDTNNPLSGHGVFCHEFSHCLGLPDLYDTRGYGLDMLEEWDLMSVGCYNGNSWCPPNYSAYEREFCGWQMPTLLTEPTSVKDVKPLQYGGETFRINNDAQDSTKIEYYIIENRQKAGWDKHLPGKGLLITHVYYRKLFWDQNAVNTSLNMPGVAYIPANNIRESSPNVAWPYTDPTTGAVSDSLTNYSKPAAKVFCTTVNGNKFMNKPITDIKVMNGLASFDFCMKTYDDGSSIETITTDSKAMLGRPASIYDGQGRKIASVDRFDGISTLPSGLYIIIGEDRRTIKIIK